MAPNNPTVDVTIRVAGPDDAPAIADLYLTSRAVAMPAVRWVHGDNAVRRWIVAWLIPRSRVWVAEIDGAPVGFLCLEGTEVTQLYVAPKAWRRGIGRALLDRAKETVPTGLILRCFLVNDAALTFYRAQGFQIVATTDGASNEESEPDAELRWPGIA